MANEKIKNERSVIRKTDLVKPIVIGDDHRRKLIEDLTIVFLVALGLIYSLHFFRHFVFPNSDFTNFVTIGHMWLDFKIPSSMKRGPLFSIIASVISKVFGAPMGSMTGTGLFNAFMFVLVIVLIYLIGRQFLGRAAVWIALIAGTTPWMVRMSSQPLAEMTLVVVIAATALAAGKGSKWAYLFAMLGSIARWDLAGLIPAVCLVDLLRKRGLLRTLVLGCLSSVPFIFCMVITYLQLKNQSSEGAHYLQVLLKDHCFELWSDLKLYWQNIFSFFSAPLLYKTSDGKPASFEQLNLLIFRLSSLILAISFIAGVIIAIIRRKWVIITLLLAGIPYVMVHAFYPYRMPRFCVSVAWIGLLVAGYALVAFWQWFTSKSLPVFIVPSIHVLTSLIFGLWVLKIFYTLELSRQRCPGIMRLAIIAVVVTVIGFFVLELASRRKFTTAWIAVPIFLIFVIFSNAAMTGFVMGDGQSGANFKRLAQWFVKNASENDRMLSTMPSYIALYANLPKERFVHMSSTKPEQVKDLEALVEFCRERNVTLIAWDSRLSGRRNDRYYKLWGLDRIEVLGAPFSGYKVNHIGDCQLVYLIPDGSPKIAVYRIISE